MSNLQQAAATTEPLTAAEVQQIWDTPYAATVNAARNIRRLCASHERLRLERDEQARLLYQAEWKDVT